MKIFRIECEWEMPVAQGYFATRDLAYKAILEEEWDTVDLTVEDALEEGYVYIEEIEVITE